MGALRVLMKPHDWTRGAVAHRPAEQAWSSGAVALVEEAFDAVLKRLAPGGSSPPRLHFPQAGDYRFVVEATTEQLDAAQALAVVLSRRLPGVWLTLGRHYVRDGRFFRRKRDNTFKFRLVPATSVHLPRATRAALCGLV